MTTREEIEGRLEAATRAPWGAGPNRVFAANADGTPATGGMRVGMYPHIASVSRENDAALIAAAPTDLRWLLAELARVTAERDAAEKHAAVMESHACSMKAGAFGLLRSALADNPDFDATDGAHPAWWRGHAHGARRMAAALDAARAERDEARASMEALTTEVRATLGENAAVNALEAIATACGAPPWSYPGQVVRDVEGMLTILRRERDGCRAERDALQAAAREYREAITESTKVLEAQVCGDLDQDEDAMDRASDRMAAATDALDALLGRRG